MDLNIEDANILNRILSMAKANPRNAYRSDVLKNDFPDLDWDKRQSYVDKLIQDGHFKKVKGGFGQYNPQSDNFVNAGGYRNLLEVEQVEKVKQNKSKKMEYFNLKIKTLKSGLWLFWFVVASVWTITSIIIWIINLLTK